MPKNSKKSARMRSVENTNGWRLKIFLRILCGIFPPLVFIVMTTFVCPAPNSGFLLIGYLGAFLLGIALFALLGLSRKDHSSVHYVMTGIFVAGIVLICISLILLYIPSVHLLFQEEFVDFYFAHWVFMTIPAIWYAIFRIALFNSFRREKKSRTFLKKSMKGIKNYWWYEQLNSEHGLGWIYHMNKCFTIMFATSLGLHFIIGWCRAFSALIATIFAISCIPCSAMWVFSSMQISQDEFGNKIVLFAPYIKGKTKKWYGYSSFLHIGGAIFPLLVAYASFKLLVRL